MSARGVPMTSSEMTSNYNGRGIVEIEVVVAAVGSVLPSLLVLTRAT
jgi:hypothetical protein